MRLHHTQAEWKALAVGIQDTPGREGGLNLMQKLFVLFLPATLVTTGCTGLTAGEKGALVGGAGGATGGALLGAASGNAAIGGPVGLLGGYFPGNKFFGTIRTGSRVG
jgi:hypothetical protein